MARLAVTLLLIALPLVAFAQSNTATAGSSGNGASAARGRSASATSSSSGSSTASAAANGASASAFSASSASAQAGRGRRCHRSGARCVGAAGRPFVPWAPCCNPNEQCSPSRGDDWGSRCQRPFSPPASCHRTGERCAGAANRPFVPWQPCCNAGDNCVPVTASNDWGSRCVSAGGPETPGPRSSAPPVVSTRPSPGTSSAPVPSTIPVPSPARSAGPSPGASPAPVPSTVPVPSPARTAGPSPAGSTGPSPVATPSTPAGGCKGFRANRREIMDMTTAEWNAYAAGLNALRANGVYARYIGYHDTYARQAHGGCNFLPWHRQYLFEFERDLQAVAPGVSIPYWDWTKRSPDSATPVNARFANDPVWTRMGGANGNGPIPNPPFQNWQAGIQAIRDFRTGAGNIGSGGQAYTFLSSQQVNTLTQTSATRYEPFNTFLEANHGTPHVAIGGTMSVIPNSPTDPIFWSHHAYVDKIWREWQDFGNGNLFDGTMPYPEGTCQLDGERMSPPIWNRTVRQILEDISQCTTYAPSSNAGPTTRIAESIRQGSSSTGSSSSASSASSGVDGAFSTTSSSSSASAAFSFRSQESYRRYQEQAAQNKARSPAQYKAGVKEAIDAVDTMVRCAATINLPSNMIESARTSYHVLLLKDGINVVRDSDVLNKDPQSIMAEAQKEVEDFRKGQGWTNMSSFLSWRRH